ncbi:MAG: DUF3311 domain-containing protein [Candidatus Hinthialibacter antarcticus]|nr:DUF3311 domain-containing protein [Candidatus Hinthialibacter antarcticus]
MARKLVWTAAILLAVLHHDFWYWNDATLLFGYMPIGLAYHVGFSIASGLLWAAAVIWAWPTEMEEEVAEFLREQQKGAATK